MAKFDLSSVTPEAGDDNAFKSAAAKDNPAVGWLRESYENDETRQVKVPANQVRTVHNMLHNAARDLKIGCAVRLQFDGKSHTVSKETWEAVKALGARQVVVLFKGKDRVSRPRKNKGETPTA
jgi:hypothetical protein